MRDYYELTKPGIVKLVLLTGLTGYGLAFQVGTTFSVVHLLVFCLGLVFISAGSLALNQVQEFYLDKKMPRTQNRPIPTGKISVTKGIVFGSTLVILGASLLYYLEPLTGWLGLATVAMYNIVYTMFLKRISYLAAVPGAIPGAAPVVLGYTSLKPELTDAECVYAFLLMFLWQMPHFWALAIRFKDDYEKGGFPVLPSLVGRKRTIQHVGIYLVPYLALALTSPWFIETNIFYYILVLPLSLVVTYEFFKFYYSAKENAWVRFFVWVNISVLCFLVAPVLDKWMIYFKG